MLKLEKAMKESGLNLNSICYNSGARSRYRSMERLFNGECAVSDLSLELLTEVAGIMGKSLADILEPFDLDGTTGRIQNIKRVIERIRKRVHQLTASDIVKNRMVIQVSHDQLRFDDKEITPPEDLSSGMEFYERPGFVMAINVDKLEFGEGRINRPYPYGKRAFELLDNPALSDNTELNGLYHSEKDLTSGNSINTQANKVISQCPAMFVYTPLKNGGDFKAVISVLDKRGNTLFTEIYGTEWLDKEHQKKIVYYKSHYTEPFNKNNIRKAAKHPISEAEFFRGIHSQFNKFGVTK